MTHLLAEGVRRAPPQEGCRSRAPLSGLALACESMRSARGRGRAWRVRSSFPLLTVQAPDHPLLAKVDCHHLMRRTGWREPAVKPDLPPEPHRVPPVSTPLCPVGRTGA